MTANATEREVLNLEQGADFLGIKPRTLRRWVTDRGVPHARIGGVIRFRRQALLEWVASQEGRGAEGQSNG